VQLSEEKSLMRAADVQPWATANSILAAHDIRYLFLNKQTMFKRVAKGLFHGSTKASKSFLLCLNFPSVFYVPCAAITRLKEEKNLP
jgi:hypothetical protein